MLVTGIILAPVAVATPAVQNLVDLRSVIEAAATTIGDPHNPNLGWGLGLGSLFGGSGQMGTADLVNNITSTIMQMQFQVEKNKTAWLLPENITVPSGPNLSAPALPAFTPTLPLSSSMVLPSTLPTALANATADLSTPYTDYVSAVPSLSTALTTLGRAYHRELNAAIRAAISALQQAIAALQSSMLQSNLISSQAVVRTLRASGSLEDAETAFGHILNLPGSSGSSGTDDDTSDTSDNTNGGITRRRDNHVEESVDGAGTKLARPPPASGMYYTHQELWGRDELQRRPEREGKASWFEGVVRWEERKASLARGAKVARAFVA